MKELIKIQAELKCKKSQFNSFGKYNYRSAEDILEAVKPLLAANDCFLTVSDEVVEVGGRIYIKATATIYGPPVITADTTDIKWNFISAVGYAREPEQKKGMDECQITGSASSYARKYALNGLFAIDDTKDSDSLPPAKTAKSGYPATPTPKPPPPKEQKYTQSQVITALRSATSKKALGDKWVKAQEFGFGNDPEVKKVFEQMSKELL